MYLGLATQGIGELEHDANLYDLRRSGTLLHYLNRNALFYISKSQMS